MNVISLNRAIQTYNERENLNYENQIAIHEIENLSRTALEKHRQNLKKLTALSMKLKKLIVEEITLSAKKGGALTFYSETERLKTLAVEIPEMIKEITELDARSNMIDIKDVIRLIERPLVELKASVDDFTSTEHDFTLDQLRMALRVRQEMDNNGSNFKTAFANQRLPAADYDLYYELTA